MSNLLSLSKSQDFAMFLDLFTQVGVNNPNQIIDTTVNVLKTGTADEIVQLQQRWYSSLESGNPDYSIYDTDGYLAEVLYCYEFYSKRYLQLYQQPKHLPPLGIFAETKNSSLVVDLGNGFGITSAIFKQLYPAAQVIGTNVPNSKQYAVAKILADKYNFSMVPEVQDINKQADLVFASEYFEHFEKPVDHLVDVVKYLRPRKMLIASAFNAYAIGHFNEYIYNGNKYTGREISRIFNKTLRGFGYTKVKTKLWNDRPNYWKLDD